jgi:hypothetical protein
MLGLAEAPRRAREELRWEYQEYQGWTLVFLLELRGHSSSAARLLRGALRGGARVHNSSSFSSSGEAFETPVLLRPPFKSQKSQLNYL